MKTKCCGGYALFAAAVVCSMSPISALAQDAAENQIAPIPVLVADPSMDDSEKEQDTQVKSAAQSLPSGQPKAESRGGVVLPPAAFSGLQPEYQVQFASPLNRSGYLSRHMMERARQILVLRRLLALHFSAEDIAVALPLLRRLNGITDSEPVDPERALQSEYEALLTASPGDPLPPSSAIKITDAARYYQEEQARIWGEMAHKLGKARADGLFSLLGQENQARVSLSGKPAAELRRYSAPAGGGPNAYFKEVVPISPAPNGIGILPANPALDKDLPANRAPNSLNPLDPRAEAPPNAYSVMVFTPTAIRISLSELIDLMQTKLDVMTRSHSNGASAR